MTTSGFGCADDVPAGVVLGEFARLTAMLFFLIASSQRKNFRLTLEGKADKFRLSVINI